MMLTVETSRLDGWFAVGPEREAGDRTIGAVVRMGERGAL
jgi:hypothetical protein